MAKSEKRQTRTGSTAKSKNTSKSGGAERKSSRTPGKRSSDFAAEKPKKSYGASRSEKGSDKRAKSPGSWDKSDDKRRDKPGFSRDAKTSGSGRPSRDKFSEERPARRNRSDEDKPFSPRRSSSRDDKPGYSKSDERPARRSRSDEDKPFSPRRSSSRDDKPGYSKSDERPARRSRSDEDKPFGPRKNASRGDNRQTDSGRTSSREEDRLEPKEKPGPKIRRTALGLSAERAEKLKKQLEDAPERLDENKPIRLNKYIANSGICGRREADKLIEAGVITVNGKLATELGMKVLPSDEVRYDGNRIYPEKFRYVLLNKPKDYITTTEDPQGRQTVMFLVRKACKERIFPVGRLDRSTTGLLLLTNDGELAKRLTHPSHGVQKIYHVELNEKVEPEHLRKIREGIVLEDGPIKADDIAYVGDGADRRQVGIEIHSGRNRVVRRIFEYFGYTVKKLDRVIFAGLTKKDLPKGHWRFLNDKEVAFLYMNSAKLK